MKKTFKTFVLMLALTMTAMTASASKPMTPPAANAADSTVTITADSLPADELEAFSDTTGSASQDGFDPWGDVEEDWSPTSADSFFESLDFDTNGIMGMIFVICIMLILFVLAPVALIGMILFFVYKNRKQRLRVAEMAMSKGRPIPQDALGNIVGSYDALWNKGIKQLFLGAGLGILLWVPLGKLGLAIGALILLIGCGNMVIAHNEREKKRQQTMYDKIFNGKAQDNGNSGAASNGTAYNTNDMVTTEEPER